MSVICTCEYSTKQYTWRNESKFGQTCYTGTTFVSDLPENFAGPLFDDAADYGFKVRSQWTGDTVLFVLRNYYMDRKDNEVRCWEFMPVNYGKYHVPPGPVKIVIYND